MSMYSYDQLPDLVTNRGKEHRMRRGVYKADGQLSIKTLMLGQAGVLGKRRYTFITANSRPGECLYL